MGERSSGEIPRHLVHKTRAEAARIVSWAAIGEAAWTFDARWGTGHWAGEAASPWPPIDPLAILESLRQAIVLTAHCAFRVPLSSAFVMRSMELGVQRSELQPVEENALVVGKLRALEVEARGELFAGGTFLAEFWQGGRLVATGRGEVVVLPAEVYRRIRGTPTLVVADPSPLDQSGRALPGWREEDWVLSSGASGQLSLMVDPSHRGYFDHEYDHVPGMVLFEAARQALALQWPDAYVTHVHGSFRSYVELRGVEVRVELTGNEKSPACEVEFLQGGRVAATVRVASAPTTLASTKDP